MPGTIEILMDQRSRKFLTIASVVLMLVGVLGIALPTLMAVAIFAFIGWLLVLAGIVVAYLTWQGFRWQGIAWLKPFLLMAIGLLIILFPGAGAATVGLLLAVYFLMDGFSGVSFAWELRPQPGWGWLMFNGVLSFLLATVFLVGWPFTSLWLIGLLIGISLFIDGVTLLMVGLAAKAFA